GVVIFFFQAEDGIRDWSVTGVQTCALPISEALRAAFAYHPPYYHWKERATNYVDYGPQNSRGFRALKVWLALRQAGAAGYRRMIRRESVGEGERGRAGGGRGDERREGERAE